MARKTTPKTVNEDKIELAKQEYNRVSGWDDIPRDKDGFIRLQFTAQKNDERLAELTTDISSLEEKLKKYKEEKAKKEKYQETKEYKDKSGKVTYSYEATVTFSVQAIASKDSSIAYSGTLTSKETDDNQAKARAEAFRTGLGCGFVEHLAHLEGEVYEGDYTEKKDKMLTCFIKLGALSFL